MEKRYQVFISSTFRDLVEERQAVLKAVLELDQMPAGMELFPAVDDSAWQLIQDVIKISDYYVLIVGGRYGSLDDEGLGYTEKEYDYAYEIKRPVIALLHENPDNLPRGKTETDATAWTRLKAFRQKVEKRHTCVYWNSSGELQAKVIVGLTAAMKRNPGIGWVRADQVPTEATVTEILALNKRISELEAAAEEERLRPPVGTEALLQGNDTFEIEAIVISGGNEPDWIETSYPAKIKPAWNEIFGAVAPMLINEATNQKLQVRILNLVTEKLRHEATEIGVHEDEIARIDIDNSILDTCVIQFRALGLIRESNRQRSVKDSNTYWTLTKYGDHLMTQLRALRRA